MGHRDLSDLGTGLRLPDLIREPPVLTLGQWLEGRKVLSPEVCKHTRLPASVSEKCFPTLARNKQLQSQLVWILRGGLVCLSESQTQGLSAFPAQALPRPAFQNSRDTCQGPLATGDTLQLDGTCN